MSGREEGQGESGQEERAVCEWVGGGSRVGVGGRREQCVSGREEGVGCSTWGC